MSQEHYTTKTKKGQHLTYEERQKIEILLKAGHNAEEIGQLLGGRSKRTIQRKISRGKVELLNSDYTTRVEYSADIAQQKHDFNGTAKGPTLKLGSNHQLVSFIEQLIIKEKYSPASALATARAAGMTVNFCVKTLYNYIDMGLFPNLTNKDLPVKKIGQKRGYHHVRAAHNQKGKSIEERPIEAAERKEYGHWELDTVVGKQGTKAALMVMTERSEGKEIVRKIASKSQDCIVAELDKIERKIGSKRFRELFKTITCDNGCENLDFERMKRSVLTKQKRTQVYYAHPSNSSFQPPIIRFISDNLLRSSLFVTAMVIVACLPIPLAAYSPASMICSISSFAGISGLNLRMLLRSIIALIISFIA